MILSIKSVIKVHYRTDRIGKETFMRQLIRQKRNLLDLAEDCKYESDNFKRLLSVIPDKESESDHYISEHIDPDHVSKQMHICHL